MCANDSLAIEFLRVILQHGVRVPDDVSVVGFDGLPEGALYWPGLTTATADVIMAEGRALRRKP